MTRLPRNPCKHHRERRASPLRLSYILLAPNRKRHLVVTRCPRSWQSEHIYRGSLSTFEEPPVTSLVTHHPLLFCDSNVCDAASVRCSRRAVVDESLVSHQCSAQVAQAHCIGDMSRYPVWVCLFLVICLRYERLGRLSAIRDVL
jgi:hypothetical protein